VEKLKIKVLIECVSGDITGKLMYRMPSRSTILFYGALTEKPVMDIEPRRLIGRN
jgi:hypothetical protein